MALMKAMSTSLIVRSHEALVTLKSCPMTTIYKPTLNWCFGRWLNRWLFACDGKKRRPNWSPFMPPTPKSRGFHPFTASKRLNPPNRPRFYPILRLFRSKYEGGGIRQIGVFYGELVEESLQLFSLFDDPVTLEKEEKLQQTIDRIRDQFGFTSLQKGSSLLENSRAIARSKLTGGHSAGGLDGLT